jgi:hypothetical protein
MKKDMEYRNIKGWVKISSPSIYKNLVTLEKKGCLDGEIVKEGEMPEKTIYCINEKGRKYFFSLMEKYSEKPETIYIDLMAFVANLHNVEPHKGIELIKRLQTSLSEKISYIKSNIEARKEFIPYHAISILELYYKMYSLFYDWSEELLHEYKEKNGL